MKEYDIIIGIDPDTNKSGYAEFFPKKDVFNLFQLDLSDLFESILFSSLTNKIFVRLEAGFTVNSTWHKGGNGMAKRVGANHEIGRQIEKYLKKNNIDYDLIKPFGGSSINHETFCKITNWDIKKRTNPETRVAGLLAYKQ